MKTLYLTHRIDSFGVNESFYFALDENSKEYVLTIEDIINTKAEIVTYELAPLLKQIRSLFRGRLPIINDIAQLKKIIIGRPKKIYFKSPPWRFWNILHRMIGRSKAESYYKALRGSSSKEEIINILKVIAISLKKAHEACLSDLKASKQFERFVKLEAPIQQCLNMRQVLGVNIDSPLYESMLTQLEKNKNALIYRLRTKYGITDLKHKSLRSVLVKLGHSISKKDIEHFNLMSYLNAARITSEICKDIYTTLRVKADYDNLLQYTQEDNNIIYPQFDCIGTVTSRILINFPHVQNLKRENRIIFKPKEGYSLIYCDYKQFEPGILASLSKDPTMTALYNSGDIYTEFGKYIFGTEAYRKEAKILFLSYLYGMSDKKLTKTIDEIIKEKGLKENVSATEFFEKFVQLKVFKEKNSRKAIVRHFIAHKFSLRRYLKTYNGKTVRGEDRFVLSQIIQGTASYILKTAILRCISDTEIEFLVPMHDAALFQVPTEKLGVKTAFIETCFIESYKNICPDINARVDFKKFHE